MEWTGLVHVTLDGTTLQKTSGCDGCDDAGAQSLEYIDSPGGYVDFTIGEANTFWIGGLSNGNGGPSYAGIDYALRFNGAGGADVLENGHYKGGDTAYAAGDIFRIAVAYGRVQFYRNGTLLYTSRTAPTYPLVLDVALGSIGASLYNAQLSHDLVGDPPPPPPPITGTNITWTDLQNVTVGESVLRKTDGCGGCDDAGARSEQEIGSAGGYVEFTVGEMGSFWVAGLNNGNAGTSFGDIDYGIRLNGAGTADVLESGVYKGGDVLYTVGDVFKITVSNGQVFYRHNGTLIYTSQVAPAFPLVLDTAFGTMDATLYNAKMYSGGYVPLENPTEGFLEKAGFQQSRDKLTQSEILSFLPQNGAKGPFWFPQPYNTRGVRLTNASDCPGQTDCIWNVGYSYWRRMNNHQGSDSIYILLGLEAQRGGSGPTIFRFNKTNEAVDTVGPLFRASNDPAGPDPNDPTGVYRASTAEGWYFSATRPSILYAYHVYGRQLRRFDISPDDFAARHFETQPAMDLAQCTECPAGPTTWIHQAHSSDDDNVHSATVRDGTGAYRGCVVYREDTNRWRFFPPRDERYTLDECSVDKSGGWLLIREERPKDEAGKHDDARVVNLTTGVETPLEDAKGAPGHFDLGYGYVVSADDFHSQSATGEPQPNATALIQFPPPTERPMGSIVHFNQTGTIVDANHVSHTNAAAGSPNNQFACGSNASRGTHRDEIVCFALNADRNPDDTLDILVVAPVMTDLTQGGGIDMDDNTRRPKGNLDVTGEYFIWTTNMGGIGSRTDAFIVRVPKATLMGQ